MRHIHVIGIGTGNPEHLTIQGLQALKATDAVFALDKGDAKAGLIGVRRQICDRYIEGRPYRFVEAADPERDRRPADYGVAVDDWHAARAALYEALIAEHLREDERGLSSSGATRPSTTAPYASWSACSPAAASASPTT